uniref:Reverse transcriptase domain-containing protein n=1 Tax=Cajanus cajan TaxID=3821 RepID=A0A151RB34_CAJCA|nr:hypothetical protein KK1_039106 [Cajanus cajan]
MIETCQLIDLRAKGHLYTWYRSQLGSYLAKIVQCVGRKVDEILLQEEFLWFQKSREKWVCFGDRNTNFFHAQTLAQRQKNKIKILNFIHHDKSSIGSLVLKINLQKAYDRVD